MKYIVDINQREKFFSNYYIYMYIVFIAGIFFMTPKMYKNYYYIFVVAPFFLTVNVKNLRIITESKILLLSVGYCFYMVVTLGWSSGVSIGESVEVFRKALLVIVFLIITSYVLGKKIEIVNLLYKYISLSAGIWAVINMAIFFSKNYHGRLSGFGVLKNPIMAASCYSVAVLLIFFCFLIKNEVPFSCKIKYIFAGLVSVVFVVLTQSRGPLLALASVFIISSVLVRLKYVLWVLGGFLIPLVAVYAGGFVDFSALLTRADSYRLSIWSQSWNHFLQQPWFGYGIRGDRPDIVILQSVTADHSHNMFLSTMLDGGLIALALIVAVIGLSAYRAIIVCRESGDATLFALVMFTVLANITDGKSPIVSPNYLWMYFWLPIGLASAYELAHSRQNLSKY